MGYVSVQEVKDEGFGSLDNPRIETLINLATRFIDQVTGQWFEPRAQTLKMDGNGLRVLRFTVPVVSVSSVKEEGVEMDSSRYVVFNRHLDGVYAPDDRLEPRIEMAQGATYPHLSGLATFTKGYQNYEIVGKWGYTDYDASDPEGATPPPIKLAAVLIVKRFFARIGSPMFESVFLKGADLDRETQRLGYVLTGDRELDALLGPFMALPVVGGA